jgi:hypothetical protein
LPVESHRSATWPQTLVFRQYLLGPIKARRTHMGHSQFDNASRERATGNAGKKVGTKRPSATSEPVYLLALLDQKSTRWSRCIRGWVGRGTTAYRWYIPRTGLTGPGPYPALPASWANDGIGAENGPAGLEPNYRKADVSAAWSFLGNKQGIVLGSS